MDWYATILDLIDLRSFSNLWYWIALGMVWTLAGRRILGVPFDTLTRAHGGDEIAARQFDAMMGLHAARILRIARESGLWRLALAAFLLALLAMLGFVYGLEFGQAVFFLLLPILIIKAMELRLARRVEGGPKGEVLRKMAFWHRFRVQMLGIVFIFVTAVWGMFINLSATVLGP